MRWIINGARAVDGMDVRVLLEAATAAAAERVANLKGIYVSNLRPAEAKTAPVLPYASANPKYTLFDVQSAVLATFIGSPLAGAAILAMNFHRLGKASAAVVSVVVGVAVTALLVGVALALPKGMPGPVLWVPQLLLARWAAKKLQGADVARHVSHGGKTASRWAAAGIAVLSGLLVVSVAVAGAVAMS